MSNSVSIIKSPAEFFNGLIEKDIEDKKLNLDECLKFYLVSLLLENIDPENLLRRNDRHPYAEDPLALIFQRSLLETVNKRRQMLKYVGDYSLYVAGFFRESLNRKIVNADYYVYMGREAFRGLSLLSTQRSLSELYSGIFNNFKNMVYILEDVGKLTISSEEHRTNILDWIKS